jgi:uncharacterized Zn finger protein
VTSMAERSWSGQFLGMLEALRMPAQFQQGRRYARRGQVRQLTISSSLASALVLDDDGETYRAKIAVRAFSGGDWNRIERALAQQAIHMAALLAGRLPEDMDQLLAGLGLSLFPESLADLALECSCPSWQVPCRHLTAACYVLADSFDTDPLDILAWRGRGRDELLARLRELWTQPVPAVIEAVPAPGLADFWTAGPRVATPPGAVAGSVRRPDSLLDQLDPLRLAAGRYDVLELLRPVYRAITRDPSAAESTLDNVVAGDVPPGW